ncbi:hypothetical protein OS493_020284 [Desmophyllum pertusum]|uniref:Uncharacterized protein n=1 Tax=Desmophyllum pertusum TaxID=174260 RepID=A0A9X0D2Z8_9CNID|nr:hypothetical protein OS493_020284 [Desmophyllum pertusum]
MARRISKRHDSELSPGLCSPVDQSQGRSDNWQGVSSSAYGATVTAQSEAARQVYRRQRRKPIQASAVEHSLNSEERERYDKLDDRQRSEVLINNQRTASGIDKKILKICELCGPFERGYAAGGSTGPQTVPHPPRANLDAKQTWTGFQRRNSQLPCPPVEIGSVSDSMGKEEIGEGVAMANETRATRDGIFETTNQRRKKEERELVQRGAGRNATSFPGDEMRDPGNEVGRNDAGIIGRHERRRLPSYTSAPISPRGQKSSPQTRQERQGTASEHDQIGAAAKQHFYPSQSHRENTAESRAKTSDNKDDVFTASHPSSSVILYEARVKERKTSAHYIIAESAEKHVPGPCTRRHGVCEAVDVTAISRRKLRVLKKKFFGDDLPNIEEVTVNGRVRGALNKRF